MVQSESNKVLKEKKRLQRQKRSVAKTAAKEAKPIDAQTRKLAAAEIAESNTDSSQQNKTTSVKATCDFATTARCIDLNVTAPSSSKLAQAATAMDGPVSDRSARETKASERLKQKPTAETPDAPDSQMANDRDSSFT